MTGSDLASWEGFGGERLWESEFLEHVEWSADLWSSWYGWLDWDGGTISDPLVSLESVPVSSVVFEDPAVVMPVALIPGPSIGGEASLGWSPVVPFAIIESIPDLVSWIPFPDDSWSSSSLAPVANLWVSSILLDEVKALSLSGEDVVVLSINLLLGSLIVLFV